MAAGVFMVIHMKNSLDEAVLYGEQEAQRYMQKSYAIRYLVVVVVFIAVSWLQIANVLTPVSYTHLWRHERRRGADFL